MGDLANMTQCATASAPFVCQTFHVWHVQVLKELKWQQQQKQAAKAPSQLSALFSETKSVEQPPAFSFRFY
jgi:hypothetical protein